MFCPDDGVQCVAVEDRSCYTCPACLGHWVYEDGSIFLPPAEERCPSCETVIPSDVDGMVQVFLPHESRSGGDE